MIARNYYRREFWKNLSLKSLAKFLLAVFFTFASMGFITDLWSEGQNSLGSLIFNVLFFGLMGTGYAYSATRNWKWIPVLLIIHFTLPVLIHETATHITSDILSAGISKQRLIIDGFGILVMIMLGYSLFVVFITGEGIPHVRLKTEIDLARRMQDTLVPDIRFGNTSFEIIGHTESYFEIGGDLIDIYPAGENLIAYTADVTGHGVAASLLMGMFKSAVHTSLQKESSLAGVINNCNRALHPLKNANTFLTTAAIRFMPKNKMEYCVAGHLPILHYRAQERKIGYHTQRQIPVSVKADYSFTTAQGNYRAGDCFLILSDGITELTDKKGREYGFEAIEKIILQSYDQPLDVVYRRIVADVKNYAEQRDDQSLLIIKVLKDQYQK